MIGWNARSFKARRLKGSTAIKLEGWKAKRLSGLEAGIQRVVIAFQFLSFPASQLFGSRSQFKYSMYISTLLSTLRTPLFSLITGCHEMLSGAVEMRIR
jgi:hypothetical protein